MTIAALFLGTIISEILFVATKVLFIGYLNMDNFIIKVVYFVVLTLITIAIVRRMGVIQYLECFFLAIVWLIVMVIVDLLITSSFIGWDMYKHIYFYFSYLVVVLAIIFFHKALHVEVRKSNTKK